MKKFWQFIIVMLFAFGLVGCVGGGTTGGGGTGGGGTGGTDKPTGLSCAEDSTQEKCSDPETWDWNYNRFSYDGKGQTILILSGAPEEVDPDNNDFSGTRKEERQLQLYDIEQAYKVDIVIEKFPDEAAWGPDRVKWINDLAANNITDKGDIFAISSDWVPSLVEGRSIAPLAEVKFNSSTKQYEQKSGIFNEINYVQSQEKIKQYKKGNTVYGYSLGSAHADFFLYYNQNLVNDYGLEDPATLWNEGKWDWTKFMDYLRTAQNAFNAVDEEMKAFGGWINEVARGTLAARGHKFVDPDLELVMFSNNNTVQMYEDLRTIKREGMWHDATGDVCPGFTAGKQLFQPAQLWFLSSTMRFASADPKNPTCDFEISVVPYPTATGDGEAKANYTIPMGADSGYAIRNIVGAEGTKTALILANIIDDFTRGIKPEFSAEDMTDEEAYRLFLSKRINSQESIEAIMSVENNIEKYGYTDYLDIISKTVGNGSDWQGDGFYTWGLTLLNLDNDVKSILDAHQANYQAALLKILGN